MPLWVDKHRPSRFAQLSYHPDLTRQLESLTSDPGGIPHLLFYGPPGAGKKTRIKAILRAVFGPGAERLRLDKRAFVTPTRRTVEVNMISSNYHVEMAPGDAGLNDRFVIQDVIKEMAQNKNIASVGSAATAKGAKKKDDPDDPPDKTKKKADYKVRCRCRRRGER